jgi:hypothetical protein
MFQVLVDRSLENLVKIGLFWGFYPVLAKWGSFAAPPAPVLPTVSHGWLHELKLLTSLEGFRTAATR